jgi:hypothetical protein
MERARCLPLALAASACLAAALAGCIAPPNSATRLNDAAYELNTAARFGRMDIAAEHVGALSREEFVRRHAEWGRTVRIVDLEYGGASITKEGADVLVTVTWQRPSDPIIRVTSITQRWSETRGTWTLTAEEEKGDPGLLVERAKAKIDRRGAKAAPEGEAKAASEGEAKAAPPTRGRFQTRVIYDE